VAKGLSTIPLTEEFLDDLDVGILLMDPRSGVIQFANKRCAELMGSPAKDVVGKSWAALGFENEGSILHCCERVLSGTIDRERIEARFLRRDGATVLVAISISAPLGRDRQPRWIAAVLQEVGLARITEQKLATAEKAAKMVTWYCDTTHDELLASSQTSIDGIEMAPTLSFESLLEHVHPDDRNAFRKTVKRAIQTGTGYVHEYRVVTKDGAICWMRGVAKCLVDANGLTTHLVGATIEITDEKDLQAVRRAPKAIQAILEAIDKSWNKPINLSQLAHSHGLGPRAVQRYFASHGMMPLAKHVKQLRLRHAHRELANPKRGTTVTAVALLCGFQNPGQFSREYRAEYGELPSETLRKAAVSRDSP